MNKKLLIFTMTISGFLLLFALAAPAIFTSYSGIRDFSGTGQIGATIGGLITPWIAILSSFLTFIAFFIQYKANEILNTKSQENADRLKKDDFEKNFFLLLKLHKDNLQELSLTDRSVANDVRKFTGVEVITYIVREFDEVFGELKDNFDYQGDAPLREITEIAWLFIFYNQGFLKDGKNVGRYKLLNEAANLNILRNYSYTDVFNEDVVRYGFGILLSRYFRFLFQIVRFVNDSPALKTDDERAFYIKLVRSVLSNNEQILLYYNLLSPFGVDWIELKLFPKYNLIRNIPIYGLKGYSPKEWIATFKDIPENERVTFFEFGW